MSNVHKLTGMKPAGLTIETPSSPAVRNRCKLFYFVTMVTAMPTGSYIPLTMRREVEKIGLAKITLVREFFVHNVGRKYIKQEIRLF